jgi:hypothetical protein
MRTRQADQLWQPYVGWRLRRRPVVARPKKHADIQAHKSTHADARTHAPVCSQTATHRHTRANTDARTRTRTTTAPTTLGARYRPACPCPPFGPHRSLRGQRAVEAPAPVHKLPRRARGLDLGGADVGALVLDVAALRAVKPKRHPHGRHHLELLLAEGRVQRPGRAAAAALAAVPAAVGAAGLALLGVAGAVAVHGRWPAAAVAVAPALLAAAVALLPVATGVGAAAAVACVPGPPAKRCGAVRCGGRGAGSRRSWVQQ